MDAVAQQMAERRERILAAAREIIGRRGYDALTMRDLARASRVTVPTIYNLVGGKEAVLSAAVEEQTARFAASVAAAAAETPAQRLLEVVEATARELSRMPRYYRALLQLLYASEAASGVRSAVDRALDRELAAGIAGLSEAGELEAWVEPQALLERLRAVLDGVSLQWAALALDETQLRSTALYGAALTLLGVTRGRARAAFARAARQHQAGAGRRGRPRPRRRGRSARS